jgi:ABC-2 type transport system permease protein
VTSANLGASAASGSQPELPVINEPFRFWAGLWTDIGAAYSQRELLRSLVSRETRQRYKGTFLGWGWALIRPLVLLAIYGLAVGLFLGAGKTIPEFGVYLYIGLIAWAYFSTLVSGSIAALPNNSSLINKASFQRELLVIAVWIVALIDLGLQMLALIAGYLFYGTWPSLADLWWVIPGFGLLTLLGVGFGLLLSAVNVRFRDIGYFVDLGLQVGFWLIPILYSYAMVRDTLSTQPLLLNIYTANPALGAVNAARLALWPSASSEAGKSQLVPYPEMMTSLGIAFVLAVLLVWLGQRLFSKMSKNIAQDL